MRLLFWELELFSDLSIIPQTGVVSSVFGFVAFVAIHRNVVIFNTKCVSEARKVTSANGRVRDDEFMVGSGSDRVRIILGSAPHWN